MQNVIERLSDVMALVIEAQRDAMRGDADAVKRQPATPRRTKHLIGGRIQPILPSNGRQSGECRLRTGSTS